MMVLLPGKRDRRFKAGLFVTACCKKLRVTLLLRSLLMTKTVIALKWLGAVNSFSLFLLKRCDVKDLNLPCLARKWCIRPLMVKSVSRLKKSLLMWMKNIQVSWFKNYQSVRATYLICAHQVVDANAL